MSRCWDRYRWILNWCLIALAMLVLMALRDQARTRAREDRQGLTRYTDQNRADQTTSDYANTPEPSTLALLALVGLPFLPGACRKLTRR